LNIAVISYSRTGTTAKAAAQASAWLRGAGCGVAEVKIEPLVTLPYLTWLLLSFIPRSFIPVKENSFNASEFDLCLLALPKWTFSCPPMNGFLRKYISSLPPSAVLVTCGGWNEQPYLDALLRRLSGKNGSLGGIALKKSEILSGRHVEKLNSFLESIFGDLSPGG